MVHVGSSRGEQMLAGQASRLLYLLIKRVYVKFKVFEGMDFSVSQYDKEIAMWYSWNLTLQ